MAEYNPATLKREIFEGEWQQQKVGLWLSWVYLYLLFMSKVSVARDCNPYKTFCFRWIEFSLKMSFNQSLFLQMHLFHELI
jgi:hypothetical protein